MHDDVLGRAKESHLEKSFDCSGPVVQYNLLVLAGSLAGLVYSWADEHYSQLVSERRISEKKAVEDEQQQFHQTTARLKRHLADYDLS